jgi:hypothetical protein
MGGFFLPPGLETGSVFDKEGDDDSWGSATTTGDANFDVSSWPSTGSDLGQPAYVNIGLMSSGHKSDNLTFNNYADFPDFTGGECKPYLDFATTHPELFGPCKDELSSDYMNSLLVDEMSSDTWRMSYDKAATKATINSAITHHFVD